MSTWLGIQRCVDLTMIYSFTLSADRIFGKQKNLVDINFRQQARFSALLSTEILSDKSHFTFVDCDVYEFYQACSAGYIFQFSDLLSNLISNFGRCTFISAYKEKLCSYRIGMFLVESVLNFFSFGWRLKFSRHCQ